MVANNLCELQQQINGHVHTTTTQNGRVCLPPAINGLAVSEFAGAYTFQSQRAENHGIYTAH